MLELIHMKFLSIYVKLDADLGNSQESIFSQGMCLWNKAI